ncbi:hypothetical protein JW777_02495 [bacterium]|nr:hypothetical protein [bacterium]
MKTVCFTVYFLLIFWMPSLYASGSSGTDDLESLEKLSLSIEKSLDSLHSVRSRIQKDGEAVAAQMDLLRSKEVLSPKEHRQMEKWLQTSQRLDGEMNRLRKDLEDCRKRRDETVGRLIGAIQAALADIREDAENADSRRRGELAAAMQDLLNRKTAWESRLSAGPAPIRQSDPVLLQPWNSPEDIRLKANLLQDESESTRDEMIRINGRIRSLREERDVRRNVAELSRELALFNEQDELLGRRMEYGGPAGDKETYDDRGNPIGTNFGPPPAEETGLELPSGWVAEGAGAESDPSDLDTRIDRLEKYRRRLAARADSLAARARWFLKKAAEAAD